MRIYKVPNSELPFRVNYSRKEIERMASDELRQADCFPDRPQPTAWEKYLRRIHNNLQPKIEDLPEGELGHAILADPLKPQIVIARAVFEGSMARYRSTLAHEIGHLVMHRHLFLDAALPAYLEKRRRGGLQRGFACGTAEIQENPKAPLHKDDPLFHLEFQANVFMSCATVPEKLLRILLAPHIRTVTLRGGNKIEGIDEASRPICVDLVATTFEVSRTLAGYRLDAIFPKNTFPKSNAPANTPVLEAGCLF